MVSLQFPFIERECWQNQMESSNHRSMLNGVYQCNNIQKPNDNSRSWLDEILAIEAKSPRGSSATISAIVAFNLRFIYMFYICFD